MSWQVGILASQNKLYVGDSVPVPIIESSQKCKSTGSVLESTKFDARIFANTRGLHSQAWREPGSLQTLSIWTSAAAAGKLAICLVAGHAMLPKNHLAFR